MKKLFIIGNGFDLAHGLPTSYGHFREFLIQNYIGDKINHDLSCCLPEIKEGADGGIVLDEQEVATFLEKIISLAEPNGEEWSTLEEILGKLDYGEVFDCIPEVYDKDGDIDLWKTSYNNEDMAVNLRETVPCIKEFFRKWINTIALSGIQPKKGMKHLIKNDSLFLTFNYTETLEKIYDVDAENICHIHGKQGKEIFFGHGDNSDYTDEYMRRYIGAENTLSQLDNILRKDTQLALEMQQEFFEKIDDSIDEIYTIGFSFGDVDLIYIKEICKRVSDKTVWYLNDHDKDKFQEFRRKIRNCGFKGVFGRFDLKKIKRFGKKGLQITQAEDKIVKTKIEMEKIYKIKHLSYEEKYDLVAKSCDILDEKELRILIKDYRRECAYYERNDETKDLINSFFTIVAILVATAAAYFQGNEMPKEMYNNLIGCISGVGFLLIFFNYIFKLYAGKQIKKIRYIQDVLEDRYKEIINENEG